MCQEISYSYFSLQVLSRKGWDSLHAKACDSKMLDQMPTKFTQGGVNIFQDLELSQQDEEAQGRDGFVGWMGLGGSVFQWHPDLQLSFAYIPTLLDWTDLRNGKALKLQRTVVQCAGRKNKRSI